MIQTVFLKATNGTRLSKCYTDSSITSYPLVKKFKSYPHVHSFDVDGLKRKHALIQKYAEEGAAMLRGPLLEPIVNESRAGKTDKTALVHTILLDIDGIRMPEEMTGKTGYYDSSDVTKLAEKAISDLPEDFHNISYIAQASNSFGLKQDLVSLHLEFLLAEPTAPSLLRLFLQWANFMCPAYEKQVNLSPAGLSLSYPLDITTAENTRIIYIAPPIIREPLTDPFKNPEDRTVFVRKMRHSVSVANIIEDVFPETIKQLQHKKIKSLRKLHGLPQRAIRVQRLRRTDGSTIEVLANPDANSIEIVKEEGYYLRCNIRGGDSQAYYVDVREPHLVKNFKGEMPFSLIESDPDLYHKIKDKYADMVGDDDAGFMPFVFRDMHTDTFWTGMANQHSNVMKEVNSIAPSNLKGYFADYGHILPEIVRQVYYEFDPTDDRQFCPDDRFINKYIPPIYITEPAKLPERVEGLKLGEAAAIIGICPTIYKIIHSMVGSDDEEFEYFINWFAYVVQKRSKIGVAYILHGEQGTGKGLFFSHIATHILGKNYVSSMGTQQLVDLSNDWVSTTILAIIDEFNVANYEKAGATNNIIKRLITEERISIRAMRKDFVEKMSYTNFIFASNDNDMIEIAKGDRRLNVCPPQMTPLLERYPELENDLIRKIEIELPQFASFLLSWDLDISAARTPRITSAKEQLRQASMMTHDAFCEALRTGNLDYFVDYIHEPPVTQLQIQHKATFDNLIKAAVTSISDPAQEGHHIGLVEVSIIYARIFNKMINAQSMGKMLRKAKIELYRPRIDGKQRQMICVLWHLSEYEYDDLVESFIPSEEQVRLGLRLQAV